jgi:hypothetical protein
LFIVVLLNEREDEQRLKTAKGKKIYGKRKDPVFGIIKQAMGFRQFLLRGPEKTNTEWKLVTLAACALGNPYVKRAATRCHGAFSLVFGKKKVLPQIAR